jgi:CDP-diacylglycerol--serine O-phosphatidyltransferase
MNLHRKKFSFRRIPFRRGLQIIPNIFTLGNAFFGFCSVIFISREAWVAASFCIFFGALMDALDGQIARLVRSSSDFGLELDSLSDAITFCLAPAFLIYSWQLKNLGIIGIVICGLFLACGLLRLAKFNITHSVQTQSFIGVPTPFAACFLAAFVLNTQNISFKSDFSQVGLAFGLVVLAGLMVCSVRIPTFKHIKKGFYALAAAIVSAFAMVFGFVKVIFFIFAAYMIFALIKYIFCKVCQIIRYTKLKLLSHDLDQDIEDDLHESILSK